MTCRGVHASSGKSSRWFALTALALTTVLSTGCAAEAEEEPGEDEASALNGRTPEGDDVKIRLEESPTGGNNFDFCSVEAQGSPVHLKNAAWLNMLSSNQYSHFSYAATQLLDLGFGKPGGTDHEWRECGAELYRLKGYQAVNLTQFEAAKARGAGALVALMRDVERREPTVIGSCAKQWLNDFDGLDEDGKLVLPEQGFKNWLLRETMSSDWIQFYNGKPYTFAERFFERGTTQASIARHSTKPIVVISFRGTENGDKKRNLADFVTDLSFFKADLSQAKYGFSDGWGKVHSGFINGLQSIDDPSVPGKDLLSAKLAELTRTNPGEPKIGIYITGHSLGGAIATAMAARLLDRMDRGEPIELRGVYTYGAPKLGNDDFRDKFEASAAAHHVTVARFRNGNDLVTSVGPSRILGYEHVGTLVHLKGTDAANPRKASLTLFPPAVEEPGYSGGLKLGDHNSMGFLREGNSRKFVSGYYERILERIPAHPELSKCASP
jgi:pimeloyl-ACP methyl ester carboxylesterase